MENNDVPKATELPKGKRLILLSDMYAIIGEQKVEIEWLRTENTQLRAKLEELDKELFAHKVAKEVAKA